MAGLAKSVFGGHLVGPLLGLARLDFLGQAAAPADQVMVVAGSAGAVQSLALLRLKGVGLAHPSKVGQCSVNRSQPDGRAVILEHLVQLLGADEPDGLAQGVANGIALARVSAFRLGGQGWDARLVVDAVLEVDLLVNVLADLRQDDLLEQGAVKQPDDYHVLDDGPREFGQDVRRVGKYRPGLLDQAYARV